MILYRWHILALMKLNDIIDIRWQILAVDFPVLTKQVGRVDLLVGVILGSLDGCRFRIVCLF